MICRMGTYAVSGSASGMGREVVEKLSITILPIVGGQWFALVGKGSGWDSPAELFEFLGAGEFVNAGAAVAETPALAICLAGYTAVEKRRADSA